MSIGTGLRAQGPGEFEDEHALVGAYALNAVDEGERVEFEAHLAGCPFCGADVPAFREVLARFAATAARTPPADLVPRIMSEARGIRQERARGTVMRRLMRFRRR